MITDITAYLLVDLVLLFFLIVIAIGIVLSRNLLVSTVLLSFFSLLMASMYLIMGAPDVAITEAAIGAGISTILLLAALLLTGEEEKKSKHPILPILVISVTGAVLMYGTLGLPAFGDPDAVTNQYLAPYFLGESEAKMGIPNVVTSILASYRGFDTMGEVFVVFTAGIGVLMLLSTSKTKRSK